MPTNGFTIEKIGGPGYEFYVEGTNYEMKPKSNSAEVGNWRIEISPKKAEKQSYFLNVMQIGDNNEDISDLKETILEKYNELKETEKLIKTLETELLLFDEKQEQYQKLQSDIISNVEKKCNATIRDK